MTNDRISRRKIILRSFLILAALLLPMFLLELMLKPHWFDSEDRQNPIWIHPDFRRIHQARQVENSSIAARNPHGFTDRPRSIHKPSGQQRIAFLGDSFMWGGGLPPGAAWPHLLERLLAGDDPSIESMTWGRNGWATVDQFAFLKSEGIHYDIDVLIVGFVSNDPDVYIRSMKLPRWQNAVGLSPLRFFFPNACDFLGRHINNILQRTLMRRTGYVNWEMSLYEEDNLAEYAKLLKSLAGYCREHGIRLLFVMTPTNIDPLYGRLFKEIHPLFEEAGIPVLDLYPAMAARFASINPRTLWANPGDSHPGEQLNEFFANETYLYLKKEGILEKR